MTLAAARDDQFLVEQDLHDAAAPMEGLLRNRDHQVPEHTVAVSHRFTIFVPEPDSDDRQQALCEYEFHFNGHRPHRALKQASPLRALPDPVDADVKVVRRDRLGGLLHEYAQVA
jgi:hypothetical protein